MEQQMLHLCCESFNDQQIFYSNPRKGDVSNYGLRGPKNLALILLALESALNPDSFSGVYFILSHDSIFRPLGSPPGIEKNFLSPFS